MRGPFLVIVIGLTAGILAASPGVRAGSPPSDADVVAAFGKQGIRLSGFEAAAVRDDVRLALQEARAHGIGNSKVDFAAVEIASRLGLDTSPGSNTVRNVVAALRLLFDRGDVGALPAPPPEWSRYFDRTLDLWSDEAFLGLVGQKGFHPVKISWEDIGRYEGSVWGDRISDVGIWVREDEQDPATARLALSVRRDSNFRDKVLVVPASAIKVHRRIRGRTVEATLPERLAELGLASAIRDRNVIVSNQFAIVPVPARGMHGAWPDAVPPRAAFTFSIFPYGSTNFVVTDVIEGSHEAVVGAGQHQLLFADVEGRKAPFTASRAEDRPDLLKLESELKAQGLDVDLQRYYLIQVPLRRDATGVRLSNMGTPPWASAFESSYPADLNAGAEGGVPDGVVGGVVGGLQDEAPLQAKPAKSARVADEAKPGLARVAIGHGETEGPYDAGGGYRGTRAEEPIRVTVVYFVTPVGEVTRADMESFAAAFARWDTLAIWGGSFVTKGDTSQPPSGTSSPVSETKPTAVPQEEIPESPWSYFNGKYYRKIWTGGRNWDESRHVCQKEGGDLAVVNNRAEFSYLSDLCGGGNICRLGHRNEGGYCGRPYDSWIDGTPWSYEDWAPGEPMFACGEDCLDINVDGKMNNEWCDNHWHYSKFSLCEAKRLAPSDDPR